MQTVTSDFKAIFKCFTVIVSYITYFPLNLEMVKSKINEP